MTSDKFIDYEVALLLAKYGKEVVLRALAQKLGLAQAELELVLQGIEKEKPSPRPSKKTPPIDPIEITVSQHPEKADQLRALHARFQNRMFLPELRDVRRFFEQHSRSPGALKSRVQSLPKLVKLLAELDAAELDSLCQASQQTAYSSLGVISDEILRRDR